VGGTIDIFGTEVLNKAEVTELDILRASPRPEYRMYVDEVGEEHMRVFNNDGQRYLSLTGVIMELDYAGSVLSEEFSRLKREFFKDHHPDDPVIFHRTDMRARRGVFSVLGDKGISERFNTELLDVINSTVFTAITVGIDKESHKKRYVDPAHPYHYLLEVLVERYIWFLEKLNARGDILVEGRNSTQNGQLDEEYLQLYDAGNNLLTAHSIQRRLSTRRLKFKRKDQDVAGLQLTDMIAFPSHRYLVCREQGQELDQGFTSGVVDILTSSKYRRRYDGLIEGYGSKWLK
jgi:hypothetical protein